MERDNTPEQIPVKTGEGNETAAKLDAAAPHRRVCRWVGAFSVACQNEFQLVSRIAPLWPLCDFFPNKTELETNGLTFRSPAIL